ncbi:MAG TPA: NADH-quinone oxidoreductase subunit L [Tepidisphaeraceae bacterium]|jgi:proton-translocating NADH-quinone oxidoreductase chain L|nr:NADH-quinone oxidoreductase subunit L [Tepidisphaeraceae bacterium]
MPTPALLLLLATLLPLISAGLLMGLGKRMGRPLAGVVGTVFIAGSMTASLVAMAMWLNVPPDSPYGSGQGPVVQFLRWLPMGGESYLDVGVYIDSLTIAMFATITTVATFVHIFSLGYMADDARFHRFFAYLGLFCFSMLGLITAGTLLQMFVFWELVGLCSYLLIGFWYERKSASNAAMKAFIMNRVGDVGFLVGIGLLVYHLCHTSLPLLWMQLGGAGTMAPTDAAAGGFSYLTLTIIGLCLFLGAVGKSAQIPLHTWLADAMEGPTPVSALIHSATMVAAGVYLMARVFPMLTPDAKLVIAIVGVTTLTFGALVALVQNDIKRVLAYSTMSQLGYMILAIGIGSWVGALFHLVTHAFFKSLLFLGAGSVIHAMHHEQDMRQYGGLSRRLPITSLAFAIGVIAIAGTPFFSGYYSKSMILTHAAAYGIAAEGEGRAWANWLLFILPTAVAFLTAFYMARCWMLTFAGRPRNVRLYNDAQESWVIYTPLLGLAMMSIIAGPHIGVGHFLNGSIREATRYIESGRVAPLAPPARFAGFDSHWPVVLPTDLRTRGNAESNAIPEADQPETDTVPDTLEVAAALEHLWAYWAFAVGIGLAIAVYFRGYALTQHLARIAPVRHAMTFLENAFYIDRLYRAIFVSVARTVAFLCSAFDKYVVDGVVNGVAGLTRHLSTLAGLADRYLVDRAVTGAGEAALNIGAAVRAPQAGRIRLYVTALLLLATFALAIAVYLIGT